MKTWQVFNPEGRVIGSVSAETIADACRKARQGYCDFPILVEMSKDMGKTIQEVVNHKTKLEIFIAGVIEEYIERFEKDTGVPVKAIGTHLIKVDDQGVESNVIQCEIHLNLNAIG